MSHGVRVFDTSGNVKLEITDRLSRIVYWNASSSGSASLPFFIPEDGCYGYINRGGGISPSTSMSFSGGVLSWSSNIPGAAFALMVK